MRDNFEKLNQLLEQEQCEFTGIPDGFTGQTQDKKLRLIYLMNDCVESFLVLENARMTGSYKSGYEGSLEASVERQGEDYVLVVHQEDTLFTVFFDDVLFEYQLYDYGNIGHFWMKKYENLRVMEYQIAILRDKYDYLGEEFCNEQERELAMLKEFPPLSYLFYPSVPEKYIVPVDNPWEVSEEALEVMNKIAKEAGDRKLLKALQEYRKTGRASTAKKIAVMLRRSNHIETVHLLSEKIRQAAEKYPARDFGCEQNTYLQNLMKEAWKKKEKIESSGKSGSYSVVYKEEPFVYDCDSISFQVCLMTVEKGFRDQKITLEYFK